MLGCCPLHMLRTTYWGILVGAHWIVGLRAHKQPMEVVAYPQGFLSRAIEWGQPVVAMSVDVATASDCSCPTHVGEQLHARGATAGQVAAVSRELVGPRMKLRIGSIEGLGQEFERGVRQAARTSEEVVVSCVAPQLDSMAGPVAVRERIVCLGVALGASGSTGAMSEHRLREVEGL